MDRLGITQPSFLSSPPQLNTITAFTASSHSHSQSTKTWVLSKGSAARANQIHVQDCYPLHSQENRQSYKHSHSSEKRNASYKWPTHNYFYIHCVLVFKMLNPCTHPQACAQNLCDHRCPLLLLVRILNQTKKILSQHAPSPFSLFFSSTIFLPPFLSEERR